MTASRALSNRRWKGICPGMTKLVPLCRPVSSETGFEEATKRRPTQLESFRCGSLKASWKPFRNPWSLPTPKLLHHRVRAACFWAFRKELFFVRLAGSLKLLRHVSEDHAGGPSRLDGLLVT